MIRDKKAQLGILFAFVVVMVILIVILALIVPIGVELNTRFFTAGEQILATANDSMANIQNATIRAAVQNSTAAAMSAAQTNIEVGNDMFRYAWVIMLVVTSLIVFMLTRQRAEYGQGFV